MKLYIHTINDDVGYDAQLFRREFEEFLTKSSSQSIDVVGRLDIADRVIVIDMHMNGTRRSYSRLGQLREYKNNWKRFIVYDESDAPNVFGTGLFVSQPKPFFNITRHVAIPYWSTPLGNVDCDKQGANEHHLMSFRGNTRTHRVRNKLSKVSFEGYRFHDTQRITGGEGISAEDLRSGYIKLIMQSRWSLCPRGYGTASFRLYETLMLGASPVLISDNFVQPSVLGGYNIVKLREQQVTSKSLIAIANSNPSNYIRLTRETMSQAFVKAIHDCPVPTVELTDSRCNLNSVLWRLFRRLL